MFKEIRSARELYKKGKLHKKLLFRLGLLGSISFISAVIVAFNIFERGLNPSLALGLASGSFLFGVWIFYRMNPVKWDEEEEILIVTKVDKAGFVIFGIYVALRLAVKFYLEHLYHNVIILTGLTLAIVFGVSFGRLVASLADIRKTHEEEIY